MTDPAPNRERLLAFLEGIRRPDKPISAIRDSDNLVTAGLIDSLAVLEIILFLETEFSVDFSATGVDPTRLMSIPSILDVIDRHGR
ncbi:MAG: acyl carrier protein [Deltaproteobacteria bacterium]|nr:acyl carrier protein [Deltaproteobacteria bacterium]